MDCEELLREYVADYLLGDLDEAGLCLFWQHINACSHCKSMIFDHFLIRNSFIQETRGRERLIEDAASLCHRYDPFMDSFSLFLGCSIELAKKFLCGCLAQSTWVTCCCDAGVEICDTGFASFHGGMRLQYLRLSPGKGIEAHCHDGDEHYFVLEGECRDGVGGNYPVGSSVSIPSGMVHSLYSVGKTDLLLAVLSRGFQLV